MSALKGQFRGEKMEYFPFTLFVTVVWIGYIGGMVYLLERAVQGATTAYPQVWWLDWLPSILLTGFAQGHTAITAMHLARLGVSALHDQGTAPRSWAELFWLADRNWAGPFGISATLLGKARLNGPVSLSSTFIWFTITCLFALPAPIVVSRAYPLRTVSLRQIRATQMSTFNPSLMPNIDSFTQLGTGAGAWATGLSVADIYNSSVFTPYGANHSDTMDDFVFAGEVSNHEVVLPAIRVQGSCQPIDVNITEAPTTDPAFYSWCLGRMPDQQYWDAFYLTNAWNVNISSRWCTNFNYNNTDWINTAPAFNASALIWFGATDTITPINGFVRCDAAFATGHATVDGPTGQYHSFVQEGFYNISQPRKGVAAVHPLFATMYDLSQTFSGKEETDRERAAAELRMLGYVPVFDDVHGTTTYTQPSLEQLSNQLWMGTSHMTASIGLLARGSSAYNATELATVSGRQRNMPFLYGAAFLLAGWIIMLVFCTVRMYRATFGDSLDSYVAARLLADVPYLVSGHCCGELSNNDGLCEPFKRVGDAGPNYPIGHVASGGVGVLATGREYGAKPPV